VLSAAERDGLAFARSDGRPFNPTTVSQRADRAWKKAGLEPVTLHECRHTFATLMIAACVNAKALQTFMGHSSITVTLDRYGHLFPGSEEEAAVFLDAHPAEAYARARKADPDESRGKSVGKLTPPGAALTGAERRTRRLTWPPSRRGNCLRRPAIPCDVSGEGGIRTLDGRNRPYRFSRPAHSTALPPLRV
jgi:Phage integrase family